MVSKVGLIAVFHEGLDIRAQIWVHLGEQGNWGTTKKSTPLMALGGSWGPPTIEKKMLQDRLYSSTNRPPECAIRFRKSEEPPRHQKGVAMERSILARSSPKN